MNKSSITNLLVGGAVLANLSSCSLVSITTKYGDDDDQLPVRSKETVYASMSPADAEKAKANYAAGKWSRFGNLVHDVGSQYLWNKGEKKVVSGISRENYDLMRFRVRHSTGSEQQLDEYQNLCQIYQTREVEGVERPDIINLDVQPKGKTKQIHNRLKELGVNDNFKLAWKREDNGWNTRIEPYSLRDATKGKYGLKLRVRKNF